jgi:hypothetical protein
MLIGRYALSDVFARMLELAAQTEPLLQRCENLLYSRLLANIVDSQSIVNIPNVKS